jgi:hypothetical protein
MHQELIVPKTFGDLMVKSLSANVNDLSVADDAITIDDFSYEYRIVHLVLSQNELLQISNELQNPSNKMEFAIMPMEANLPLSTVTGNGQFRINLSWEPQNIESGSKTRFLFDIMDIFLIDRPISVSYDLSIIHDGEKLFQKSGVSTDSKTEHNTIEFLIPNYVTGPIILQFENLDENSLASASLPVVVNRIEPNQLPTQISVPSWVKNNAGWWANDQISDSDFVKGIEYMIKEGIIKTDYTPSGDDSSQKIPAWIKNNAGWWSEGQIDDKTFVSGIQYLIKVGIIKVS